NLVVVETADAVLVADRGKVQDVKRIVNRLKEQSRPEVSQHRRVYRPWGSYESLVMS
ncbi:MAG: mannose-1-phosphate guanylyltransferase/mannose-6-phosphate isomerase, partial [Halieaceae bacterium]|nr:mannose-1-phosphate guanylyltransferase/mannose-6-phosphate isomerase [Halieaceae bacterium]